MEDWVSNWLAKQRELGEKGLEVKKFSNGYYLYRSTTYWDKALKKRRKKSAYIGRLDKNKGLIESQKTVISSKRVRSIWEYGNTALLNYCFDSKINPQFG